MVSNPNNNNHDNRRRHNEACSACNQHKIKCVADCPLAPYFPHNRPQDYANVHRLFHFTRLRQLLNETPENERDGLIKSIQYEANMRAVDPVFGCTGVVRRMWSELERLKDELQWINDQIACYRGMEACPDLWMDDDQDIQDFQL